MNEQEIAKAVRAAIESVREDHGEIKVGISQRHVHLSREDLDTLFGKGYELTKKKTLMGREFASNEVVTLVGPSLKSIENVRVLDLSEKIRRLKFQEQIHLYLKSVRLSDRQARLKAQRSLCLSARKAVYILNRAL